MTSSVTPGKLLDNVDSHGVTFSKIRNAFFHLKEQQRSPKLRISLLILNTIISDNSDKKNIREFVWEIIFRTICH